MATNLVINETPTYNLTVVEDDKLVISLSGSTGPAGPVGPAGASGTITTSTSTNLAGYIFGNGTSIAGATSGSTSATASTIAIRDASSNVSAGAFLLPNNGFTGTIDNATLTGARAWTLPDKTGYVALTQNANGSVTNSEIYVKASVPITAGQAVYISGASGANKLVTLAQANIESTSSKTLGIALQNIAANGFGYVVTEGDLTGLSINLGSGHGIAEGDPIWLSPTTAGGLLFGLANQPTAPNHLVSLGYVTRITGNTLVDIFVKVQNGFELDELHDVAISNLSNGQVLTWENSTQLWKNKALDSTVVMLTGAQTVAGAKSLSGQMELTGQAATNATSAMTRALMAIEPLFSIGQCSKPLAVPAFTASGTAATASQIAGDRYVSLSSGTAVNGYAKASIARGLTTIPSFTGATIEFSKKIGVSMRIAVAPTDQTGRLRIIVGSTGVPATADQNALTTRGFGFEVANNSGTTQVRTFAHSGTAYTTGSWVTFGINGVLGAYSDGAGNISLIVSSNLFSRASIASTQTGGPTSATGANQYLEAVAVNASTGTTTNVSVSIVDVNIYTDT